MEQARLVLAIVLSFLVLFLWEVFLGKNENAQNLKKETIQDLQKPEISKPITAEQKTFEAKAIEPESKDISRQPKVITIKSPLYVAKISEKGALFTSFKLKNYKEFVGQDAPFKELIPEGDYLGNIQVDFSGQNARGAGDGLFLADAKTDSVEIGSKGETITFLWRSPKGIIVEKKYQFLPNTYLIGLSIGIKNDSGIPFNDDLVLSLLEPIVSQNTSYGFEGPSALVDNRLEQIEIKNISKTNKFDGKFKWIAQESIYFIASIIPKTPQDNIMATMSLNVNSKNILQSQYIQKINNISQGSYKQFEYLLFLGPKSTDILKEVNYDLNKAIDFGMFDFIAKPCLWLMNMLYKLIPNYGIAIIILTTLIKLLLWPLGNKSYQSMNEMKKIQPLMAGIREKYKNDKKKMNEELMLLYRTYKVNPLGGCLPMVLQIPVFFGLYKMLYGAIELRHAHFFGWINDLSAPDRLFNFSFSIPFMQPPFGIPVLTIIMGATMLIQQKMSPPPGDPTQAKMMMFMPVVFTFIFINFPSGLVVYWLINNILSITQQYYITKKNA